MKTWSDRNVQSVWMRKLMKIFHTLSSCGVIGALAAYAIVLIYTPQDNAQNFADMRQTISAISNYLLLPSLAVSLVTGLLAMAVHPPFQNKRWAWVKALLGIGMFESTLAIVQAKANYAATQSIKIANGEVARDALDRAIANEWYAIVVISVLSIANIVLGVWRPRLARREAATSS